MFFQKDGVIYGVGLSELKFDMWYEDPSSGAHVCDLLDKEGHVLTSVSPESIRHIPDYWWGSVMAGGYAHLSEQAASATLDALCERFESLGWAVVDA